MHQRSLSELQRVSTQRGASTRRTNQDPGSSKQRRGSGCRCLCPPRGALLWAWLLLGALVIPGAWSFLDEEQEELLVELHNYYRGQVSPTASAMMPLRWDPNLKVIAEGYAAKCVWNHNPELEETGENLFAGTGALDLRVALEKWFMEHLDYDFHNNSCDEDKMCGHYTQMVWADTHRVGCALHLCNDMEGLDWERVSFLVCNYYPAGNYEDERPYVEGDWCSRCPENLQKCENNLCVDDTVDDDMVVTETEGWTLIPPPATSDPPEVEEEEEEKVVPPPATTDPYVQPATTTTASTPSITTTSSWDSEEDTQPPATPVPGTHPPEVPSTTVGEEENVEEKMEEKVEEKMEEMVEEKMEEMVEEKMEEKVEEKMEEKKVEKEEEKRKETTKKEGKDEFIRNEIYQKEEVIRSAGSVSSPSLLLACLTGMLTLRL